MDIRRSFAALALALSSLVGCAAQTVEPAPEQETVAQETEAVLKNVTLRKADVGLEREAWTFEYVKDGVVSGDRIVFLVEKATQKPLGSVLETADPSHPVTAKIGGKGTTIAGFPRGADVAEVGRLLDEAWIQAGKPAAYDLRQQSDGCTMSPDGWWVSCCNAHDACYDSCGGRSACDSKFYTCMDRMTGGSLTNIAEVYYGAVRTMGWMFYDC
jgi:hypothetical protein